VTFGPLDSADGSGSDAFVSADHLYVRLSAAARHEREVPPVGRQHRLIVEGWIVHELLETGAAVRPDPKGVGGPSRCDVNTIDRPSGDNDAW
jgi:hypothetical protein